MLRDNIAASCGAWTNNNCESVNHMLKSAVQWHPQKLPDLVDKLRQLVDSQYVDADRALHGRGQFSLKAQYAKHRLTVDEWRHMVPAQRIKAQEACFRLPAKTGMVTSTDGSLTVKTAPSAGKKPYHRKRPAADKTVTVKRRRL